ncbi:hypothetical protein [Bacillus bingmayongensis]|nr:hypothetical protein [Bacillus bingmayongensis]
MSYISPLFYSKESKKTLSLARDRLDYMKGKIFYKHIKKWR